MVSISRKAAEKLAKNAGIELPPPVIVPIHRGMTAPEAAYSLQLRIREAAGEIQEWQYQPTPLKLVRAPAWMKRRWLIYTADFLVYHHDGVDEYVEIKAKDPKRDAPRFDNEGSYPRFRLAVEKFSGHLFTLGWYDEKTGVWGYERWNQKGGPIGLFEPDRG